MAQEKIDLAVDELLAKLLAQENINIHNSFRVKVPSFDLKSRTLLMPVWGDMSKHLRHMLNVHETGHALDTPHDEWMAAIDNVANHFYQNPTDSHKFLVKQALNICEDPRIDRRAKRRYPGSRKDYFEGMRELHERDYFELKAKKKEPKDCGLLDRINLYFKGGVSNGLDIPFSDKEWELVNRIERTESFADVVEVTKAVYQAAIDENKMPSGGDEGSGKPKIKFEFEGEGEDDKDEKEKINNGQGSNGPLGGKTNGEGLTGGVPMMPETYEALLRNLEKRALRQTEDIVYVHMPKINLKHIMHDYKVVLKDYDTFFRNNSSMLADGARMFNEWKSKEKPSIMYMVKEFEMKKAADAYARSYIAKTGMLDLNKVHQFKYAEDIFKRNTVVPIGKSHGFVMFIDWSGSMQNHLKGTMEQLMMLTMFCRRVGIPFEVYLFRDHGNLNCFTYDNSKAEFHPSNFTLRNIFSSRMKANEFDKAMQYFYTAASRSALSPDPLTGTPLNEAIIAANAVVEEFRDRTKVQICNVVFLTDGASNHISYGGGGSVYTNRNSKHDGKVDRLILTDDRTKRQFQSAIDGGYGGYDITNMLLRYLKHNTKTNTIGFFLTGNSNKEGWQVYGMKNMTEEERQDAQKLWDTKGFAPVKAAGYDTYFVLKSFGRGGHVNNNALNGTSAKEFSTFMNRKTVNKVLLNRFIDMIVDNVKEKVKG